MPLQRRWRSLDRETLRDVPDRYGVYELGSDCDVVEVGEGPLREKIKDAISYADAETVRWNPTPKASAGELAAEHRDRAGLD